MRRDLDESFVNFLEYLLLLSSHNSKQELLERCSLWDSQVYGLLSMYVSPVGGGNCVRS
jgi:hypothetical protein